MAGAGRRRDAGSVHLSSSLRPDGSLLALARDVAPAGTSSQRPGRRLVPVLWAAAAAVLAVLFAREGGRFVHAIEHALHARWPLVALGAAFEALSVAGYVLLLHRVVATESARLRVKDSYDITLAGAAVTRLLPTAGLGGAAVTVWALRARGLRPSEITERLLAFFVILYGVYLAVLAAAGGAVALGLTSVSSGRVLGLLGVGLGVGLGVALLALLAAPSLTRRLLHRLRRGSGHLAGAAARAEQGLPALRAALADAWRELRHPHAALLGAVAWWGFDLAVLTAMLHVFGATLPLPAVALAYFLGTLCNLLPLPGSLSGGLSAALVALGAPAGEAIAAVLAYRALAVWLPAAAGITSLAALRTSVAGWRAA
jgi:uncharacterized membrane protein YbhN (UPF0104 family)